MKRLLVCLLAGILLSGAASADWYTDGSWRPADYWYYADQPRYAGERYEATLAEMETMQEAPTPETIRVTVESIEGAERQLAQALKYAPHVVAIAFDRLRDAKAFDPFGVLAGAAWTRTERLYSINRIGRSVMITIDRYAEGWLAYVDTSPIIRVYADEDYCRQLAAFRETWIDPITGTDVEKVARISEFIGGYAAYDEAEAERLRQNGGFVVDTEAHSIHGFVTRRRAVCDAYAAALQMALACHGIRAFEVIGSGAGNHAWNMVQVDGAWEPIDALQGEGEYATLQWVNNIYGG